ncbi:hypothetical protein EMIT0324P_50069 [Pseudomonas chlororaphis]
MCLHSGRYNKIILKLLISLWI